MSKSCHYRWNGCADHAAQHCDPARRGSGPPQPHRVTCGVGSASDHHFRPHSLRCCACPDDAPRTDVNDVACIMAQAEAAHDENQEDLLEEDDLFIHPDELAGDADSSGPPNHLPQDGRDPNPGPGKAEGLPRSPEGPDGAAVEVPEATGDPPKPDAGTSLLYASVDVEFTQSNKFIGEIFQMSVVLFATEAVTSEGKGPLLKHDMRSTGWSSYVKPSLLFGKNEFSRFTTEVCNCVVN